MVGTNVLVMFGTPVTPPGRDIGWALDVLETRLEDIGDRDVREDREVVEAIAFLKTRLWRMEPVEQ